MHKNRREVIQMLSALGASAALSQALAQHMQQMQTQPTAPASLETIPARAIPWEQGTCAFCEMPLKTPAPGAWMGRTFTPGFFEQTYSQIALKEPQKGMEAIHFESIACMVNYAWVYGLRDGVGSTFYVADRGAYDPARGPAAVNLIPARQAVYLWGEKRGWVVMDAKVAAFRSQEAAMAFARTIPDLGRTRILDWQTLVDLAPLPEMNLVNLLAKHAGLLK
ncbi:MAG: nitrous oxide reductase accessory protein NosL [Meiothermus sp.]|uniref:nitrous oxide reductase accessory protein NosL n=1 Tax=Meiothermus sp. TaxID=1955249 RepID=UPI0025E5D54E|nr:nitrous oxide reductase accessory protein NosL [Meiothermus sp.]MCS7069224.1 nitrous oxide reductase accessory protein NosL [Meiothermus sp.]MDW8424320.1 nitrous oxide reductase accessory protein NosL [Meiothermus sp.]